ncbi:putative T7SS-secreted protein [Streptomyces griseorubiginosus]|uniref:Deoxyribonuclease RhsC n=1 Tax=Streptomyces griseorubiginosus TaxID=67304 RepID=A0AAI8PNF2_9ACTN|nr:polymorphic toxin type 28 domain-containing protein [Streptomyces griseorubiginosus]AYC38990.1 Putative deoxyribonuclease RhsC [Streptomyces griseorubiginosus]
MGFGDLVDDFGDGLESAAEGLNKGVGEAVGWGTDKAAGLLSDVGADGAAEKVRDFGESVNNRLGGTVAEHALGETEDPRELIHGSAGALRERAGHLRKFAAAFENVGQGMRSLDPGEWRGRAADAFRAKFDVQPKQWLTAADACTAAAGALESYAETVSWAQERARAAIETYRAAQDASRRAADTYEAQVSAYNQAADRYNATAEAGGDPGVKPTKPSDFVDPGTAGREEAQEILAQARSQRTDAADEARRKVAAALQSAPPKPEFTDRVGADAADLFVGTQLNSVHVLGGLVRGGTDVLKLARTVNPLDPYNLTHPGEWSKNSSMLLAGLVGTAAHPERLPMSILGTGWSSDPGDAMGYLASNLIGGKGAGGVGRAALKDALRGAAKDAAAGAARNGTRRGLMDVARELKCKVFGSDPIDMATGRMSLPQTDVSLPARLPLVFTRQFESSYRAGRWFGPCWTSTADQRLEIDAEGVVLVREDGSLLAYPHPAPGVPVLPLAGEGHPLTVDEYGDYTVTDPVAGRVWDFAGPGGDGNGIALLSQIIDRSGQWLTFEYDDEGAPTGIVHSAGHHVRVERTGDRISALHLADPEGGIELVRFGYDDGGHLSAVTKSSGLPTRFTNDTLGRITAWTDTNNSSYHYAYDDEDRCVAQGGEAGHLSYTYTYGDPDPTTGHRIVTAVNSLGHGTRYEINKDLQVAAVTDPDGATTYTTYDQANRPLTVTDPQGRVRSYTYDEAGRTVLAIRPDGRYTSIAYSDQGLPVTVAGADGTHVTQQFDERGNCTAVTDASGATTHFAYDDRGHLESVANALGEVTRFRCNAEGLPLEVTDPLGATTCYERDAFGRPVKITDPTGAVTRLEWTVEGRLTRRTAADGTSESWTYDGEGNCTSHTDALGAVSRYEYTHFDLLSARTGPDGTRHTFEHDTELRLTRVSNPQGLTWNYAYDSVGRLTTETDFDDRTLTYGYDSIGQLMVTTTVSGETVCLERDLLGKVIRKEAAGAITTFEYDLSGALIRATGPDAVVTVQRDTMGRALVETVNGRSLTYRYDALGRCISRTTPAGATTTWAYDAAGNPSAMVVSGRPLSFTHDEAGRELSRSVAESLTLTHTFDPLGRLTEQDVIAPTGRRLQHRSYTYRADGNLTAVDDHLNGAQRFELDAVGRVTTVHAANWTETYAYDEMGNQTQAAWPSTHPGQGATGQRAYTGTRITRAGNVRYEYDAAGRMSLRQKVRLSRRPDTWHYEWDAENRLRSVTTPDGSRWRYTYDPLGRRTAKLRLASDGTTVIERVDFVWDGTTLCEQTTTSASLPNPVTLTWDHQGLHPIAQTERINAVDAPQQEIDSRFFAIVTDLVGTPLELVDERGDITWRKRSTLWGKTAWPTDSSAYTPLRFPGQYYDPETALHYNYFRHYDPETARYVTPDPLGLAPADNPVAYVHNPHVWTDSLGLSPYRDLGLREDAMKAIRKLENIKKDPIGEINSQPNHNHYSAARREAQGEVVARKPDGTPFDHIADLKGARNGLDNVRLALERELEKPPPGITERGIEVLLKKRKEAIEELDRLNGFLHSIGHP